MFQATHSKFEAGLGKRREGQEEDGNKRVGREERREGRKERGGGRGEGSQKG